MIDIFYDSETTGINPYCSEIIEAYFKIDENNDYYLKAKVDKWSIEAEEIHKIPEFKAMQYHDKKTAYRNFLNWLPESFRFITYANMNTELGFINFDVAILENELNLLGCPNYFLKNKYKMKQNISVHTMAKEAVKNGLFKPVKRKSKTGRMIPSYKQEDVYYALFGERYNNAHDAKVDVIALERIYKYLIESKHETTTIF